MYVQIIVLIIILVLGGFIFKTYPFKADVKKMSLAAILILLNVLLNRFSMMVPLFGFPSLKISFEIIPLIIAGMLLSPSYAFIVGLSVDLIGLIVVPTQFPFLGFTLNNILRPLIPSLWVYYQRNIHSKTINRLLEGGLIIPTSIASIYIFNLKQVVISKEELILSQSLKYSMIALLIVASIILIFISRLMQSKLSGQKRNDLTHWILLVSVLEIGINLCLTPIWLQTMYNIPFMASLLVRILKACLMIPINSMMGYSCYELIKKVVD